MAFAQEVLRRDLKIEYQLPSGTRSEAIDEEVAEILYRSGCRQMNYAPESGSAATLARIKKKVKLSKLEESLRGACRNGLKVMVNIILFPDDSRRDVFETFKFMLRCSWLGLHDIAFVPYVPYPGAELYNQMAARTAACRHLAKNISSACSRTPIYPPRSRTTLVSQRAKCNGFAWDSSRRSIRRVTCSGPIVSCRT